MSDSVPEIVTVDLRLMPAPRRYHRTAKTRLLAGLAGCSEGTESQELEA